MLLSAAVVGSFSFMSFPTPDVVGLPSLGDDDVLRCLVVAELRSLQYSVARCSETFVLHMNQQAGTQLGETPSETLAEEHWQTCFQDLTRRGLLVIANGPDSLMTCLEHLRKCPTEFMAEDHWRLLNQHQLRCSALLLVTTHTCISLVSTNRVALHHSEAIVPFARLGSALCVFLWRTTSFENG